MRTPHGGRPPFGGAAGESRSSGERTGITPKPNRLLGWLGVVGLQRSCRKRSSAGNECVCIAAGNGLGRPTGGGESPVRAAAMQPAGCST